MPPAHEPRDNNPMNARPLHGPVGIQASSFPSIRRTETYSRVLHVYTFPFPPQLPLLNKARWGLGGTSHISDLRIVEWQRRSFPCRSSQSFSIKHSLAATPSDVPRQTTNEMTFGTANSCHKLIALYYSISTTKTTTVTRTGCGLTMQVSTVNAD